MKIRVLGAAAAAVAGLVVGTYAGTATATAATPVATTTKVIANNPIGKTPGKLVVTGIVKPVTGTAVPKGRCSIVIDTSPAIVKKLNTNGGCSITTHVKLGSHTIEVSYSGSAAMAASSGSTTVDVTR
jgi:hypothetical protein